MGTRTISSADNWEQVYSGGRGVMFGTTVGAGTTVALQRRRQGESTWVDVLDAAAITAETDQEYACGSGWELRLGVKTGNYAAAVTVHLYALR